MTIDTPTKQKKWWIASLLSMPRHVKKMVQDELDKLLKKKDAKDQVGEIVKKIMKKLYKDLSLEHPYIIDRIKI